MSDANLATLAQIAETSWSVLPASPTFRKSRFTKDTLNFGKETVVSSELRDDRQIPDILLVGFSSLGGYEFELSTQEFDLLLQNALFCTPTVVAIAAVTVTCTPPTATALGTIVGPPGTFPVGVFPVPSTGNPVNAVYPGQRLMLSATTGGQLDGTVVLVESVSTDGSTLSVDQIPSYSGPASFSAKTYRNGTVRNSMALEKKLTPTSFMLYQGCMNNTFKLTLEARKIATGTCDFIGKGAATSSSTAGAKDGNGNPVYNPQTTNPVLNCSNNVGQIKQGGAPINTGIKMVSVEIANNLRPLPAIGQSALFGVGLGRCEVKGSMQMYFSDNVILNMFISHTKSSFGCVLSDGAGGALSIDMPSIQYETGKSDVAGINTDVMLDTTYGAFRDPVLGYEIQICEFLSPVNAPTITSLTPNTATLGGLPTVNIVIAGTNFLPTTEVLANGSAVPSVFVSPLQINCTFVLPTAAATVNFQVFDPVQNFISAVSPFTVAAATPTITSLSPSTAVHGTNNLGITITGTNFLSSDVVQVDGATIPSTYISPTQINVVWNTPATAGSHAFTVKDPVNNITSAASTFTVT